LDSEIKCYINAKKETSPLVVKYQKKTNFPNDDFVPSEGLQTIESNLRISTRSSQKLSVDIKNGEKPPSLSKQIKIITESSKNLKE